MAHWAMVGGHYQAVAYRAGLLLPVARLFLLQLCNVNPEHRVMMVPPETEPAQHLMRKAIGPRVGLPLIVLSAVIVILACAASAGDLGTEMAAAIFTASLVSSVAGFAFSALAGAMLFHLLDDPVRIVTVMIICSIANQSIMTWKIRRHIHWAGLCRYCASGLLGLPVGVWMLLHADRVLYTHLLGGFLLTYGGYMLLRKAVVVRHPPVLLDLGAGFLGGITGAAAAFPSVFLSIWCGMKGWDKTRQRAVIQPFILVMQLASFLSLGLTRRGYPAAQGFHQHDLVFVPASLLGTVFGMALFGRLTDLQFARAVNLLLIVSGLTYAL